MNAKMPSTRPRRDAVDDGRVLAAAQLLAKHPSLDVTRAMGHCGFAADELKLGALQIRIRRLAEAVPQQEKSEGSRYGQAGGKMGRPAHLQAASKNSCGRRDRDALTSSARVDTDGTAAAAPAPPATTTISPPAPASAPASAAPASAPAAPATSSKNKTAKKNSHTSSALVDTDGTAASAPAVPPVVAPPVAAPAAPALAPAAPATTRKPPAIELKASSAAPPPASPPAPPATAMKPPAIELKASSSSKRPSRSHYYNVVHESAFTFETDLPPTSRDICPSGVLHAVRFTPPTTPCKPRREEHTFAWIEDSSQIDSAMQCLDMNGFDCSDIGVVFIPYSTKSNWVDRYPHALPSFECKVDGEIVVYMNWRPYPNGLGELEADPSRREASDDSEDEVTTPPKKVNVVRNWTNTFRDKSYLSDAERDELHIEIYNYLSWFAGNLSELERKEDGKDGGKSNKSGRKKRGDVHELQCALDKLRSAFCIIPEDELDQVGVPKGAPFLEEALGDALSALVEARRVDGKMKRRRGHARLHSRKRQRCAPSGWNVFRSGFMQTKPSYSASDAWGDLSEEQKDRYNQQARALQQPARDTTNDEGSKGDEEEAYRRGAAIDPSNPKVFDNIFRRLEQYKEDNGGCLTATQAEALSGLGSKGLGQKYDVFEYPDGINRRVSPNWECSKIKIRPMYHLWHCGDEDLRMCPVKMWEMVDIEALPVKRAPKLLSEVRRVMKLIDNKAAANGVPPKTDMTYAEVNECFDAGKSGLNVPLETASGKPRDLEKMTWSNVLKNLPAANNGKEGALPSEPSATESNSPTAKDSISANDIEEQASVYYRTVGVNQTAWGNWQAEMRYQRKRFTIGTYKTQEEAARINEFVRRNLEQTTSFKHSDEEWKQSTEAVRDAAEAFVGCKRTTKGNRTTYRPRRSRQGEEGASF